MIDASEQPTPAPSAVTRFSAADRQWLFRLFFLGAFAYLIYQSLCILSPFATALTAALILVLVFYPLHARIVRVVGHPNPAAALTTVLALLLVILPFFVLGWLLLTEAASVFPHVQDLLMQPLSDAHGGGFKVPPVLLASWQRVAAFLARWHIDLGEVALENVRRLGNSLTSFGTEVVKNSVLVVIDVVVLVIAIFFFFRDGPALVRAVVELIPMEEADKRVVADRLDETLSAIVRSAFITATAQGALAGLGFAVADVRFPVLLGFAAALLAVVPVVGAGIVWGPVGLYLLLSGQTGAGIGILLWGAIVVTGSDNVLRTIIISGRTQLSLLLLLPGILGGIQVYGVAGALIGPLVIATLLAFARIYHEQYAARPAAAQ